MHPILPGAMLDCVQPSRSAFVDLYWIPLGADGHCVRLNGTAFEAIQAARQRRARSDLYHAALIVAVDGEHYTIELAPAWGGDQAGRGVVRTGPVGNRRLGRWRLFRYEVRCWRGGSIPDLQYAVGGPRRLSTDPAVARRLLAAVAEVPTPVWGLDELGAGDMWNSNSVIAWLVARGGAHSESLRPPAHGRAPGWEAGLVVAARDGAGRPAVAEPEAATPGGHSARPAARAVRTDAAPTCHTEAW